jgi:3-oxoacyl-[acyl-carrier-protein] synthase III
MVQPRLGIRLAGTGMAVPDTVLTNADLAARVETSDEWIMQRTGIRERRILNGRDSVRDLAREATLQAMANAGVTGPQLDMLICATLRPEMVCPSTAARVVAEIGATPAAAVDLNAACSGFVYALNFASSLIRTGTARTVAVVGAEALSKVTDWADRRTCVLFGDGAGAAILTASEDPQQGLLHQIMASDGGMWKELYCPRNADQVPEDDKIFSGAFDTLQMNGREIYKFAVATLQKTVEKVMSDNGLRADDLAMVIAHQSNARILESARERLGLAEDKLYINIDRYGNTSAASIPICLHELNAAGRISSGDLILFVGLGGGLTWASALWRV